MNAIQWFNNSKTIIPFSLSGGVTSSYTSGTYSYMVHTFLSDDTVEVIGTGDIDYLMVGGGGGGGYPGGGGAGGLITGTKTITEGSYPLVVGDGGNGSGNYGFAGGDTTFDDLTAYGGGGGGYVTTTIARCNGANGGGGGDDYLGSGATYGIALYGSQGNDGGAGQWGGPYSGGGGGGFNSVGDSTTGTDGGNGGTGGSSSISGTLNYYAGGGGGGAGNGGSPTPGINLLGGGGTGGIGVDLSGQTTGAANTGGGGGGGLSTGGATGGSGITILRYETPMTEIIQDNLYVYLDASKTASYPGSGSTWTDIGSKGLSMTLNNSPTFGTASDSNYIRFDGNNQTAVSTGNIGITGSQPRTICLWYRCNGVNTTPGDYRQSILRFGDNVNYQDNVMYQWNTGNGQWLFNGQNWGLFASGVPTLGDWAYYVFSYNGATAGNIYENGVNVDGTISGQFGVQTLNTLDSTLDLAFLNESGGIRYFNGDISQVQIYDKELTADEILFNYNIDASRYAP